MPGSSRVHRSPATRRVVALAAACLLALTACGGDDDGSDGADDAAPATSSSPAPTTASEPSEPAAPPTETGSAPLSLVATEVEFAIELPSTDLEAGVYEIEVVNDGTFPHDLSVERDGAAVAATEMIEPGESATLSVPLDPGEYVFYCSVGDHRARGMEVTVTVT